MEKIIFEKLQRSHCLKVRCNGIVSYYMEQQQELCLIKCFSQTGNGTTALILSYMSFAIGYIAGPFGAIFFGHIGDRKGRKVTMYASLLMMGISTSIIESCHQQQAQELE